MNLSIAKKINYQNKNFITLYSIIISAVPLSYILGNLFLNLNILLIIALGFYLFLNGARIKFEFIDKTITFLFLFIVFTSTYNSIENYLVESKEGDFTTFVKSIMYLRYLFLYLTVRILVKENLINFKTIYFIYSLAIFLFSIDVIYQFLTGTNIFGYVSPFGSKNTGLFYEEAIAGSFIQRFSFFLLYFFPIFFKFEKKFILIFLLCFLFTITITGLFLAGNRMPFALFVMTNFIILLTTKTLRKNLIYIALFLSLIFGSIFSLNKDISIQYKAFVNYSIDIADAYKQRLLGQAEKGNYQFPEHLQEFDTFYLTWKMNPVIGGGIKSYRHLCPKRGGYGTEKSILNDKITRPNCNTHPHNYYLEIITEIGVVGLFIIIFIFLKIIYDFCFKFNNYNHKLISTPFFYIFFIEAFPIKSSGSFFTTGNSIIIFLFISFIVGLMNKNN
tara:strand:+ start:6867 stop:8204 length:1338 start_codon:yes stop_codon:yes gene_type:complete